MSPYENLTPGPNTFEAAPRHHPRIGQPVTQPSTNGVQTALLRLRPMELVKTLLPKLVRHLKFDEVGDYAMQNLDLLGNKYYAQYLLLAQPDSNGQLDVPDECLSLDYIVSASNAGFGIGSNATPFSEQVWMAAQPMRAAVAGNTATADPVPTEDAGFRPGMAWVGGFSEWDQLRAMWGHPLPVTLAPGSRGARLQLARGTGLVLVSYKARIMHQGYPLLTPKEALSSAYYCEYVESHDLFMQKKIGGDQKQAAEQRWEQSLTPARNEGLDDREGFAALANTLTSMHRHLYGSPVQLGQW